MMAVRSFRRGAIRLIALLSVFHGSAVLAGPAEDYEEGAKRYASGDLIAAMPPLRKAADAGNAPAQAMLAEIFAQSDSGAEAVVYYRKAALQGNAAGQFGLGAMLAGGEGAPKDVAEGRKWITRAAEQGHKQAINELALAYINGNLDIPAEARRSAEAMRWIRPAADHGFLPAMERLALAYRNGELGLTADAKAAGEWDEKVRKVLGLREGRRNKRSNANEPKSP
jgi:TPR repeat protein